MYLKSYMLVKTWDQKNNPRRPDNVRPSVHPLGNFYNKIQNVVIYFSIILRKVRKF